MQHPLEQLPFILVSGQARSGTTMLTKAIAEHDSVYSNRKESSVIDDIGRVLTTNLTVPHRQRQLSVSDDDFVQRFRTAMYHVLFPWNDSTGRNAGDSEKQDATVSAKQDAKLWGKSEMPQAVSTFSSLRLENVDHVKRLFPNVVFANIFRNGVEVVASRMIHPNIGSFSFEQHCTAWAHSRDIMDWGQGRDDFVAVAHHDMLDRGKTTAAIDQVLLKANITNPTACVDFIHSNVINTTVGSNESKEDLSKRIERWRSWTAEQKNMFENICGETMQHFGFSIPWA